MALKKELEILVSDSHGGEEWQEVLSIDFEEATATLENAFGEENTVNLNGEFVHDIRITE